MPVFERNEARIHYEIHGDGFPVLALAPGGMRSSVPYWRNAPYDPIRRLSSHYRVVAMDQRNAGQSTAPITGDDGWQDYLADQLGLLDHLGIGRFHVIGMCIGGSFIMELIRAVPDRVASAVMLQPIGYDDNRQTFFEMFDSWAEEVKPLHPSVSDEEWARFRETMFGGDFLFNVGEDVVAACPVPLLVAMGTDVYHPEVTSRRIAGIAPQATLIERWKEPEHVEAASAAISGFLAGNS
ncbi:alpha/beta fold hydrolase [Minwuia sp.]|uniref:alpha/beta fold hydrolase n=1 Tax=Minwuia sp. TaxID=2493630 RepID=UPI003A95B796